ncbi:MAG: VWA domain-containing protein [Chloroflexota bacterium]|nr:VWA domain-containing protein [Chloroflexota bacterium]
MFAARVTRPPGAQVGVVAFSDRAFVADPLSSDVTVARRALDGLSAGGGTAIGDGLNQAVDQLMQRPADAQGTRAPAVVVLLGPVARSNTWPSFGIRLPLPNRQPVRPYITRTKGSAAAT